MTDEEQSIKAQRREKLIAALRSGEYKQTQLALRKGGAFCCLGVACELYRKEESAGYWDEDNWFVLDVEWGPSLQSEELPETVADWYGFSTTDGRWLGNFLRLPRKDVLTTSDDPLGMVMSLMAANDSGYTFAEIADIIEAMHLDKAARLVRSS
jgi:hypothetical protein